MNKGGKMADSPRVVTHNNGDGFVSPTDTRAALQMLRRACLEWPPNAVADEVSQVLLEGQEPDATLAQTTHQGIVRVINDYLMEGGSPDAPPDWLTPSVIERISERLRSRVP